MKILSLLSPLEIEQIDGIPSKAICGKFESENTDPMYFIENNEFTDLMHTLIERNGSNLTSLIDAAEKQKDGYLYIIDLRTPEGVMGNVPTEDIIGAFKVENGKMIGNSYWRNKSHKIFTKNGLVNLPPELFLLITDELKK